MGRDQRLSVPTRRISFAGVQCLWIHVQRPWHADGASVQSNAAPSSILDPSVTAKLDHYPVAKYVDQSVESHSAYSTNSTTPLSPRFHLDDRTSVTTSHHACAALDSQEDAHRPGPKKDVSVSRGQSYCQADRDRRYAFHSPLLDPTIVG